MPNLISADDLNVNDIQALLNKAQHYAHTTIAHHAFAKGLAGYVVANLFFEPSTRTQNAFEIAQKRHAMVVQSPVLAHSALVKGESVVETVMTMQAMGVDAFVIRHQTDHLFQDLLNAGVRAHLMNAGCGTWAHPTQALIDLAVIMMRHPDLSQLTVAIIGDVKHSRVARSQIRLLTKMNVGEIRVIAPESLAIDDAPASVLFEHDIKKGLDGVQVIICLRLQEERFVQQFELDKTAYVQRYCLTPELLAFADPKAIVLHPGPCMVGIDMTQSVADSPQSMVLKQVQQAVPIRMAVLDYIFGQL